MARRKTGIYVLKLVSGFDVIGQCFVTEMKSLPKSVTVKGPLSLVTTVTGTGGCGLYLQRYMHGVNTDVIIDKSHIITVYPANDVLSEYYLTGYNYQNDILDEILNIELQDMTDLLKHSSESLRDDVLKGRIKDVFMASKRRRKTLKTSNESSEENDVWHHKPKEDGKVH